MSSPTSRSDPVGFCTACGTALEGGIRFCGSCGTEVGPEAGLEVVRGRWRGWPVLAVVLILTVVGGVLGWLAFSGREVTAASVSLGPEGGMIVVGDLSVIVPPEAVGGEVQVSVSQFDPSAPQAADVPAGDVLSMFDVTVDGELLAPVRMELRLPDEKMPLEVFHRTAGGSWEPWPVTVDRELAVTWGSEFSEFAFVADTPGLIDPETLESRISTAMSILESHWVPEYAYDWDGGFWTGVAHAWTSALEFVKVTELRGPYDNLYWAGVGYRESAFEALQRAKEALDQGDHEEAYEQYQHGLRYGHYSSIAWVGAAEVFSNNLEAAYIVAEGLREGTEWALRIGSLGSGIAVAYGATATTPLALQLFDRSMVLVRFAEAWALDGATEAVKNALAAVVIRGMLDGVEFDWDGFSEPQTIAERVGFGLGSAPANWSIAGERLLSPETARHVFIAVSETVEWGLVDRGEEMLRFIFGDIIDSLLVEEERGDETTGGEPWPMFRADAARTGHVPGPGIVGPPVERWRFETGDRVVSSPAVVDGVVYVGSFDHNLYALDAATGTERWRFRTDGWVVSSPAVVDGVVYVGRDDFNVYALDADTGTERWRFETGSLVQSSPAVVDGVVYVGSLDGSLYALDADTGTERWRFRTGELVVSSPAVVDGMVYVGSDAVYALDADTGTERWQFETGDLVESSPAVVDGVVYVGGNDGNVYALDAATGTERWRFLVQGTVFSSGAVVDGVVYVGSLDGNLYALDAATGTERWRFDTGDRVVSSGAVVDGVVYVGSWDGNVYALEAATGTERWRFETGDRVVSSPAVVDGVVYFGSDDGNLYALESLDGSGAEGPPATPSPEFALREDGIGVASFGDPLDDVLTRLTELLGPPDGDFTYEEIHLVVRSVSWGPLAVDFVVGEVDFDAGPPATIPGSGDAPTFERYWVLGRSIDVWGELLTERGVGVGSTVSDLQGAYGPDVSIWYDEDASFGPNFFIGSWSDSPGDPCRGTIWGSVTGDSPTDTIESIGAGFCPAP